MSKPETRNQGRSGHRLSRAMLGIPLRVAMGRPDKGGGAPQDTGLRLALDAERQEIATPAGVLSFYVSTPPGASGPPRLLIHSINAAGSGYEMKPFFAAWRGDRTVYALDLPGFGFSERSDRVYDPRLMADAILAMAREIRRRHPDSAIDAMALSLSCEFLARAAAEHPSLFRTLALVSPTGFDARGPRQGPPGSTRAMPALHRVFTFGLWRKRFFKLLASRVSIRYFLEKTWGSKDIDEGLLDYDYATTHQPGAEHAPYCFISGYLFSNDITNVYETLSLPVWMAHGVRGDFTDYSQTSAMEARPNWRIDRFDTGALPHFEQPDVVSAAYETFLRKDAGSA